MLLLAGALPSNSNIGKHTMGRGWRLSLAGGMAGMLSNSVLHPLDTVKTVRQADPKNFPGVSAALAGIIRKRGPLALYAGIGPAMFGSFLSSALYFGTYEFAKQRIATAASDSFVRRRTRVPLTAVSAACGNIASSVLFVPKEVVKQRMQSGVDSGRFFGTAANVVRTSGMAGLYRGYKATLLRNIPSTMIRFAVYEELKLFLLRFRALRAKDSNPRLSTAGIIASGSIAGSFSSACTTPMDVLKTRFATGKIKPGTGIVPALRDVVRSHGIPGLFVGIRPRMLWSAMFAAIGFTSYEICKAWALNEPIAQWTRRTAQRGSPQQSERDPERR